MFKKTFQWRETREQHKPRRSWNECFRRSDSDPKHMKRRFLVKRSLVNKEGNVTISNSFVLLAVPEITINFENMNKIRLVYGNF